jgi:hypothetical protein
MSWGRLVWESHVLNVGYLVLSSQDASLIRPKYLHPEFAVSVTICIHDVITFYPRQQKFYRAAPFKKVTY